MQRATSVTIGLGAMAGSLVRWGVGQSLVDVSEGRSWALLAVNTFSSVLLGALIGSDRPADRRVRDGCTIGFCGGLSTMSTFAVDVADGLGAGDSPADLTHSALLLVGSLAAAVLGYVYAHARTASGRS